MAGAGPEVADQFIENGGAFMLELELDRSIGPIPDLAAYSEQAGAVLDKGSEANALNISGDGGGAAGHSGGGEIRV